MQRGKNSETEEPERRDVTLLFGASGSYCDAFAVCSRGGQKQPEAGDKADRPYWKTVDIGANDKKHTLKNDAWM